jgi:hypothetical protein
VARGASLHEHDLDAAAARPLGPGPLDGGPVRGADPGPLHLARLGHLFPYLPGQSGYNKRLRAAAHLVVLALRDLAVRSPSWCDGFRLLDATPLPCAQSRETVERSALWPHAAYGYDRSHSRWYWGFKLYLLCAPDGMPISWCLATPRLGEREVAEALVDDAARQRALAAGTIILADKGFAGRAFHQHLRELGAWLVRPDRKDEPRRFGSLGGMRQWIESVINTLKDQLGLEQHHGRTLGGVFVRVGQRLLALAAAVWFNWQLGVADKRSLVAYDH